MKVHVCRVVLGLCILLFLPTAQAVERTVWAEITRIVPLTTSIDAEIPSTCHSAKPEPRDGLATLLAWDLRPECAPRQITQTHGYDVYYRWDGRNYRHKTLKHPGKRMPLIVNIK